MRNLLLGSIETSWDTLFRLPKAPTDVIAMSTPEFKFYCPHCDQPLKCDPCHAGRQIQCPNCNYLIRIPNPPPGTGFTQVEPQSGRTWDTFVPKGQKA